MRFKFAFFLFFIASAMHSQRFISGKVTDQNNANLTGASITATGPNGNALSFAISDGKGNFKISVPIETDSISVSARYMGYEPATSHVGINTSFINLVLLPSSTDLPEVYVKSQAIAQRGDTLSYNVSSFATQKDRNLADVLSKMPGIEVEEGGRVIYQGKAITKFYIEGLDLLGGKYNLATANLPHADVSQVQILEGHQPIRMLESLANTDDTAINIKLKKGIAFTGSAEAGSGLEPLKWEANSTPMLFTKEKQFLASMQSNNTGRDLAIQNRILTVQDAEEMVESLEQGIIAPSKISLGDIANKRWLDNNATYISSNALLKGNADTEYKINASFLNDNRRQFESSSRLILLDNETISIQSDERFASTENSVEAGFSVLRNLKSQYFSNIFKMNYDNDNSSNGILLNGSSLSERFTNSSIGFRNDANSIFSIGGQIVNLRSRLRFQRSEKTLGINPGVFSDIINSGQEYQMLSQEVMTSDFYMLNSASIIKKINSFVLHAEAGLSLSNNELDTEILKESSLAGDLFRNDFELFRSNYFVSLKSEYEHRKFSFRMTVPFNYTIFSKTDAIRDTSFGSEKLFLEPELFLEYKLTGFWKLNLLLQRKKEFFKLQDLYQGYIVRNYQDISINSNVLPEKSRNNVRVLLAYRNPITSFFTHFAYTLSDVRSNVLADVAVDSSGLSRMNLIYFENSLLQNSYTATAAKAFDFNNLSVKLNLNYASLEGQRTINAQEYSIKNTNYSIVLGASADIFRWFNLEYSLKQDYFQNYSNERALASNEKMANQVNANFYVDKRNALKLSFENFNSSIANNRNKANFLDFMYRHSLGSKKIDFQLNWDNIFNVKQYRTFSVDELNVIESNFRLRDSQLLFKVYFSI